MMELITKLKAEFTKTNTLIKKIDRLLDSSQPNLEGKVRVVFWHTQGKSKETEPVIIVRDKELKPYPNKIINNNLAKRAKSSGIFSKSYFETYELLNILSDLLKYRKRLKDKINMISSIARGTVNANKNKISLAESKIDQIDQRVHSRLKHEGLLSYYKRID